MVLGLAHAGVKVVATAARTLEEVESVASEAGADRVLPLLADVTLPEDCERVVDTACRRLGGLHLLVNNAGRGMKYVSEMFLEQPPRFWEADPGTWRMIIDTNVNGPFFMARAALPVMLAQHWGRIVNISMNRATMRRRGFSPYGPSKAALESETIIWAQDLEGSGVTVNALLPGGATATGMIPANVSSEVRSKLLAPEIIVPPLLWLASEASDGVTGRRIDASNWRMGLDTSANIANAVDTAGCLPRF
jgi:3-oxoacyl-[acyl-carrier protein] reductase